jgi:tryptophanase
VGIAVPTPMELDAYIQERIEQNKKKAEEPPQDEIEVIDDEGGHTSECAIYEGGECNCK